MTQSPQKLFPIIGLVGPSGSGKTTLILEMVARFPDRLAILKSLTTRPKRSDEDDLFYDFVSVEEMLGRQRDGRLIQISDYAGNHYGNDREYTETTLAARYGINALVEDGVANFRKAGFRVIVVRVVPMHQTTSADPKRQAADLIRAKQLGEADFEIINSFGPGGKEIAVDALTQYISLYLENAEAERRSRTS